MDKEKQIEDMAKVLCQNVLTEYCASGSCSNSNCLVNAKALYTLYNAGYRKASDVAREIFEEIDKRLDDITIVMGALDSLRTFHKTIEKVTAEVNELKKKYTVTDTNVTTNTEET